MQLRIFSKNTINLLLYFSGIAISGLLSFIFIPIVIKMYGVEIYGKYSMNFNLLCIISMFCYAWLGQSFIRFYSHASQAMFSICLSLLTKSLLIGALVFAIICKLLTSSSYLEVLSFLPSFLLFGYYCFFLLVSQAKQKAKMVMFCEVLRTLINIVLLIIFNVFFKAISANYALVLSLFSSYLIPTIIIYRKASDRSINVTKEDFIEIKSLVFNYGIPIGIFLSASLALSVNDRYIISYFMGKQEAGIYSAIYDVINKGVTAFFSPLLMTFYPIIAALYNSGNKIGAIKKIKQIVVLELIVTIVGLSVLILIIRFFLHTVFQKDMPESLYSVCYMVYLGVCFWQVSILVHKPLELLQKTKIMAITVIICLVVNFILNIFGINYFKDLRIPAFTTIITSLLYLVIVLLISNKKWQKL